MGRLELPAADEAAASPAAAAEDWTWIVLEQAPPGQADLIGRRLRLTWAERPQLQNLVRAVSTDMRLGEAAERAERRGDVVPRRLEGRREVGPLESLAGSRPHDDMTVRLEEVRLETDTDGAPLLRIGRPPVQITGRWSTLARILGPASPQDGDGDAAEGDRFRIRHFDPAAGGFDGPEETVRIPRQPPDRNGRRLFDPRGLATSPAGRDGWILHGSPDAEGLFTVQALEPRSLFRLQPDRSQRGTAAGLRHLLHGNWQDTPQRRGRLSRVALWPSAGRPTLLSPRGTGTSAGGRPWQVGDTGLVIHAFGGIGGVDGEPTPGFTVTGHFAFGQADVELDPFTGEPRFRVLYHQIYANNPNAIVAGSQDWSAFSGNLQRGWLGTRPISDVLVRGDGPLLRELAVQAEVLAARYRSGDGTGVSTVTPATSCVQDSAQALFIALDRVRRRAEAPAAASLQRQLEGLLTPFGTVRPDWRRNAEVLEGGGGRFERAGGALPALLSWRSMMPRRSHDDLAGLLLRHGSPAWILRTNQVPGADPRLEPLAPTLLLGRLPVAPTLVRRLADALFTGIGAQGLALGLALLGGTAALVLPGGLRSGFLRPTPWPPPGRLLRRSLGLVLMPSLLEELIFRVLLLPQPGEGVAPLTLLGWSGLGLGLFVAYHPLAGSLWYPPGRRLFRDPRFLVPCTLLGVICTVAYLATGSLWLPVLLHAAVVITWLERLGGRELLAAAAGPQG
jgi:predicted Abi (CAAX) family protease